MNEVEALPQMMLQQVAKDVTLRINDVALRAKSRNATRYGISFAFARRANPRRRRVP